MNHFRTHDETSVTGLPPFDQPSAYVPPPSEHSNRCNHFAEARLEKKDFTSVVGLPLGKPICRKPSPSKQFIMHVSRTTSPVHRAQLQNASRSPPAGSQAPVCSPLPEACFSPAKSTTPSQNGLRVPWLGWTKAWLPTWLWQSAGGLADIPLSILANMTNYS